MDDIRNTSALFVGGQDTAPHTERTARELWQLLFQKTENEMAGYMNRLDQLSRDELIQAADEISAMMTCHSELMAFGENLSRKKMIFLLQQEKPLELLSEAWMEHQTVDVGETFQSLLTGLYDETRQTQVRDMVYAIQPKTIEELLTSYPDDYFQLMTPCGFVDLTPSETEKLLHGEATMAHPGVSGCQMPVVPFPVSWTVKMKKKQKETQDILSYHSQAAGCSDKARAKASGGRQPIEECGRTGL